jgi:hypothetical protein
VTPYNPTFVLPSDNTKAAVRNFYEEGKYSSDALKKLQKPIVDMYKELYDAFSPESLSGPVGTGYEPTAISRLSRDLSALQAAERRELSAEDIRNAQQSAREAYSARGQAFAPGAVGAEILGRDALARQREQEARTNYQQSMGNVANAVQLKTGNLFAPISNLLQGTFNPYSSYANQVYDYNANAYNEFMAAKENLAAYKEAAAMGQEAQFLNSFANFLSKNGIQTTQKQISGVFQSIMDLFKTPPTPGAAVPRT